MLREDHRAARLLGLPPQCWANGMMDCSLKTCRINGNTSLIAFHWPLYPFCQCRSLSFRECDCTIVITLAVSGAGTGTGTRTRIMGDKMLVHIPGQVQCEKFYTKPYNSFVHVSISVPETTSVIKPELCVNSSHIDCADNTMRRSV